MNAPQDLWRFSLRVYGSEPVAVACLWLQDHRAIDVNLLLFGCWLGSRGIELTSATLGAAQRVTGPWTREVVAPLRRARRWMKTHDGLRGSVCEHDYAALRERIKAAELESERLEQLLLQRIAPSPVESATHNDAGLDLMLENTSRYFQSIDVTIDDEAAEHLCVVLAGAAGSTVASVARLISQGASRTDERH